MLHEEKKTYVLTKRTLKSVVTPIQKKKKKPLSQPLPLPLPSPPAVSIVAITKNHGNCNIVAKVVEMVLGK